MCGISGYISNKTLLNENGIDNTIQLMKRRGPDSNNYYKENLSIIDHEKLLEDKFFEYAKKINKKN